MVSREGGLLIEGPRTPRGPRIPDLLGFRRRRRLLSGVFFPVSSVFLILFFFIFVLGFLLGFLHGPRAITDPDLTRFLNLVLMLDPDPIQLKIGLDRIRSMINKSIPLDHLG